MANISPRDVFDQVSKAVPKELHKNIIIVGSLAAGYHFFGGKKNLDMRTKDVDCLLSPHIQAVGSGKKIVEKLLKTGWVHKKTGEFTEPGTKASPVEELPLIRLFPPAATEPENWFIEFLIEPEKEIEGIQWKRIELSSGHYALCGFRFLRLANYNPLKAKNGIYYARPEMMALANILEHPEIKPEKMSSLFENRAIKRSNKDLGRVLAIARLSKENELLAWPDLWEKAVKSRLSKKLIHLMKNAGSGIRELIQNHDDMDEAVHTCNFGLLASRQVTFIQLEVTAKRLLQEVIIPFENKFK